MTPERSGYYSCKHKIHERHRLVQTAGFDAGVHSSKLTGPAVRAAARLACRTSPGPLKMQVQAGIAGWDTAQAGPIAFCIRGWTMSIDAWFL